MKVSRFLLCSAGKLTKIHISVSFDWNHHSEGYVTVSGRGCKIYNNLCNLTHRLGFPRKTCYFSFAVGNQLLSLQSIFNWLICLNLNRTGSTLVEKPYQRPRWNYLVKRSSTCGFFECFCWNNNNFILFICFGFCSLLLLCFGLL